MEKKNMSCYNSTVINSPIEKVWNSIRNFHELPWGEPVVTSVEAVGDIAGDTVGAKRILNGAFHETLTALDDSNHSFTYTIDDGPGPVAQQSVSNYIGSVRLLPITDNDSTFIEWSSAYDSGDPQAVADFCNPIYIALLAAMKEQLGS